jgi:hypothetical protein
MMVTCIPFHPCPLARLHACPLYRFSDLQESVAWVFRLGDGAPDDEKIGAPSDGFSGRDDAPLVVSVRACKADSGDDDLEVVATTFLDALNFVP